MSARNLICLAGLLVALLSPSAAIAQNTGANNRKLMTEAEYGILLDRIAKDLTGWEAKLQGINPGKGNPSYAVGTQIDNFKTMGLFGVSTARTILQRLKTKRTISEEIALADSVGDIFFAFSELDSMGVTNLGNPTLEAMELSTVEIALKNDGMDRLRLLENSACAPEFNP